MDSNKRPTQGSSQQRQKAPQNGVSRPSSASVGRQHAVHKTPEELSRAHTPSVSGSTRTNSSSRPRTVPASSGTSAGTRTTPVSRKPVTRTPSTAGRSTVDKDQSSVLEFSVAPSPRAPQRQSVQRQNSSPAVNSRAFPPRQSEKPLGVRILSGIGKGAAFFFTFLIVLLIVLAVSFKMIASNSNPAAQEMFVTTLLETGQLKFLANMFTAQEDIDRIVNANKSEIIDQDVDSSLIDIPRGSQGTVDLSGGNPATDPTEEDITIEEIAGASYHATMMIVKDPSRVSVATIYPWREEGDTLDQIANACGAIGAINGGLYNSYNNSGGMPYGVVVSNHEIQYNRPEDFEGLFLIGLTDNNILEVIDINGWTGAQVENVIAEKGIRDAVTFQEEATDSNNHFVQLIINGEKRDLGGKAGSGLNPRTAIGQRADGAILMLVTDGRGKAGHLGASAADLIDIMSKYGAVNAVNLDGGSSSCMYYNGDYLMTSVTFYYTNASWKLPLAFVVK